MPSRNLLSYVQSGEVDAVLILLHDEYCDGSDAVVRDDDGITVLHWACFGGHERMLQVLLNAMDEHHPLFGGLTVNDMTVAGVSPLHAATSMSQHKCVHTLLTFGCDVDLRDSQDRTALQLAAELGATSCVAVLLSFRAQVDLADLRGDTALRAAASNGHVEIVRALLERGASVNRQDEGGATAAHWASLRGHVDVVEVLQTYGMDELVLANTVVLSVEIKKQDASILPLQSVPTQPKEREGMGFTVLHWAAANDNVEVVTRVTLRTSRLKQLVLQEDSSGGTALHWAANQGAADVVAFLTSNSRVARVYRSHLNVLVSAIHWAEASGQLACAQTIRHLLNQEDVTPQQRHHNAASESSVEIRL